MQEKDLKQLLETSEIRKEDLKTQQVLETQKPRPQSLKEYLKLDTVKQKTVQELKNVQLGHYNSLEHHIVDEEVHIKNYCKLVKHLLKLEYHQFDHDWFPNVNRIDSSNLVDLRELSFIPGRVERFLQKEHPKKLKHSHTRIFLEH
jgi:hypothetical protein